jgi:hypothetical protein
VALSLLLIAKAVIKNGNEERGSIDWRATGRALTAWSAFAVAIALMGWLGFLLSFALLTFFIVAVIFRRPLATAGMTAVGAALGFYLVFPVALNLPLPTGVLGF